MVKSKSKNWSFINGLVSGIKLGRILEAEYCKLLYNSSNLKSPEILKENTSDLKFIK